MAECARTVHDDEVFTALYGYGAGLPVVDETGAFTGGYRRKLTFGEVNGGVNWVGDDCARQLWGLPGAGGSRVHRFGEVTFSDVEDPAVLLARTQAALAEACKPKVSYEAEAAALTGAVLVGLGDEVAVVDSSRNPAWRMRACAGPGATRSSSRTSLTISLRASGATLGRVAPRGLTARTGLRALDLRSGGSDREGVGGGPLWLQLCGRLAVG